MHFKNVSLLQTELNNILYFISLFEKNLYTVYTQTRFIDREEKEEENMSIVSVEKNTHFFFGQKSHFFTQNHPKKMVYQPFSPNRILKMFDNFVKFLKNYCYTKHEKIFQQKYCNLKHHNFFLSSFKLH